MYPETDYTLAVLFFHSCIGMDLWLPYARKQRGKKLWYFTINFEIKKFFCEITTKYLLY